MSQGAGPTWAQSAWGSPTAPIRRGTGARAVDRTASCRSSSCASTASCSNASVGDDVNVDPAAQHARLRKGEIATVHHVTLFAIHARRTASRSDGSFRAPPGNVGCDERVVGVSLIENANSHQRASNGLQSEIEASCMEFFELEQYANHLLAEACIWVYLQFSAENPQGSR